MDLNIILHQLKYNSTNCQKSVVIGCCTWANVSMDQEPLHAIHNGHSKILNYYIARTIQTHPNPPVYLLKFPCWKNQRAGWTCTYNHTSHFWGNTNESKCRGSSSVACWWCKIVWPARIGDLTKAFAFRFQSLWQIFNFPYKQIIPCPKGIFENLWYH